MYQNKISILIIFIIVFAYQGQSQDSLVIPTSIKNLSDTADISRIIKYAKKIHKTDIESASKLFSLGENASLANGTEEIIVKAKYEYAVFLHKNGNTKRSFIKFQECNKIAGKIKSEKYYYYSKLFLGEIHMVKSNYNLATEYTLECLKYFEAQEDYSALAGAYLHLTYMQVEQKDYEKAEEYGASALKYAEISEFKPFIAKALLNVGAVNAVKKEYDDALINYKKALKVSDEINFEEFKMQIFLNIGEVYFSLNDLDSAEFYSKKILDYEKKYASKIFLLPIAYIHLSEIYEKRSDYKTAKEYAYKALTLSDSSQVYKFSAESYKVLSRLYFETNEFRTAYTYKVKSAELFDSLFSEEKYRIQNDLESIYETNKKQMKLDDLTNENEINKLKGERFRFLIYLLIFIVLIAVTIAVLIIKQNKIKAGQETLELEQKLLRTQMNPHFIFNSISAIQDFILTNNPIEASSYLADFSKLMRAILMNSSSDHITLHQEKETVESYLKLQAVRLEDKMAYSVNISDELDQEEIIVPPMLLQPFIENSIVHGIMKKVNGKGIVKINIYKEDNKLILENEDNGIGREASYNERNEGHVSKAVLITEQRINLLSKKYKEIITFKITDLKDEFQQSAGTLVRFKLPFNYS